MNLNFKKKGKKIDVDFKLKLNNEKWRNERFFSRKPWEAAWWT